MNKMFVFVLVAVALVAGCSSQKTVNIEFKTLKGVSLSPYAFTQDGMEDFLGKAGEMITWGGDWSQLIDNRSAPHVIAQLSSLYGYKYAIITEIKDDEINSGLLRSRFRDTLSSFAQKYHPGYIGIGNEINLEYDTSPQLFEQKMEFYGSVYDSVKAVSPDTKVFTVFQLERMKGIFPGRNGTQWQLLDNASKFDIIAFTTYPSLVYGDPSGIENDYYAQIRLYTPKPLAFTEAAWGGDDFKKSRFIKLFFLFNSENHPEFAIWPFLYSQNVQKPFDEMGLITNTTTAFDAWTAV